jgi:hypothetical protein
MARSSIEDVVMLVRYIEQQRGKAIKQTLTAVERVAGGELDKRVRKAILDGFNNYTRSIYTTLGYDLEA